MCFVQSTRFFSKHNNTQITFLLLLRVWIIYFYFRERKGILSPFSSHFLSIELCDRGQIKAGFSGLKTRIALFRNDVTASLDEGNAIVRVGERGIRVLSVRGCIRTLRDTRIHDTPSTRAIRETFKFGNLPTDKWWW